MVIQDSLPLCGDQDSTLVHPNPEDWINTPWMMDLLDREREGQAAAQASSSSSACSPGVVGGNSKALVEAWDWMCVALIVFHTQW